MKRTLRTLIGLLLLLLASGCADSPASLTHELLVFWNEVCDTTVRITDDATAQQALQGPLKRIDKRRDDLKDRADKRLRDVVKKEQALELEEALIDAFHEIIATEKRVKNCQDRLRKLSTASSANNNILAVLKWIEEKKDFNNLAFGSTTYISDPRDPKAPKQFGFGLMLPWPQMEKTVEPPKDQPPPGLEQSRSSVMPPCPPAWIG